MCVYVRVCGRVYPACLLFSLQLANVTEIDGHLGHLFNMLPAWSNRPQDDVIGRVSLGSILVFNDNNSVGFVYFTV